MTTDKKQALNSRILKTESIRWDELKFLQAENFKELPDLKRKKLKSSIIENNFSQPFYVWENDGKLYCLDGKHRTDILNELVKEGYEVPEMLPATFVQCVNEQEAAKLVLVYSSIYANVTQDGLVDFLEVYNISFDDIRSEIDLPEFDSIFFEAMLNGNTIEDIPNAAFTSLQERFIIPPFSIFDSRQGYWQDRKRKWHQLGINSQESREDIEVISKSGQSTAVYELRNKMREAMKRDPTWEEILAEAKRKNIHIYSGASVFDPVLCEVLYRWFCPDKAVIEDPFAGGSVRGLVASFLGHTYHGIDLREDQVLANRRQATELQQDKANWYTGDSKDMNDLIPEDILFDFVFSCPPYHDLEQYSDDPRDLSNMDYHTFMVTYRQIVVNSLARLKVNRFACFVVSEIRDKNGKYRNFVADTIDAFTNYIDEDGHKSVSYYNEIILINVAGSLPIRVGKQFAQSRKVGRTHQNILVFYKGDPKKIKEEFPAIKVEELLPEGLDDKEYQPNIALSVN